VPTGEICDVGHFGNLSHRRQPPRARRSSPSSRWRFVSSISNILSPDDWTTLWSSGAQRYADRMKHGQSFCEPQVNTAAIAERRTHDATANKYTVYGRRKGAISDTAETICPTGGACMGMRPNIPSISYILQTGHYAYCSFSGYAGMILTSFVTPPTDIDPTCSDGALQSANDTTLTGKDADTTSANRCRPAAELPTHYTASSDNATYGRQS